MALAWGNVKHVISAVLKFRDLIKMTYWVQEELLYYGVGVRVGVGVSKKFNVKVFYVMGKALSGELSCPCDRSCNFDIHSLPWFQIVK